MLSAELKFIVPILPIGPLALGLARTANTERTSATGRCLICFSLTVYIAGCVDEDRVLIARCSAPQGAFSAAFSPSDAKYAVVGVYDNQQAELGSLFQVFPGNADTDGIRWTLAYKLGVPIKHTSHSRLWFGTIVHTPLETDVDEDTERLAEASRTQIESTLAAGTRILAMDVQSETIPDVLRLINQDPKALNVLQSTAEQSRYLVLSAIAFTKGAGLFYEDAAQGPYSIPWGAPQIFKLGKVYFHVKYACPSLDSIGYKAASTGTRVPTTYFYTAVRYDIKTKRAQLDGRMADPHFFRFLL